MEIPQELKTHLQIERDQWDVPHLVCIKCRKRFFSVRDATLHLYHIHDVKAAQKFTS